MRTYFNAHNHGIGSLLDGLSRPAEYAQRAKELGHTCMTFTDHGTVHTLVDGYEAATEAGLKYAPGIEAYQARKTRFDRDDEERAGKVIDELEQRGPYHLTILARNNTGYRNLIKLSSRAYTEGFYVKPRIDHELLAEHADGLIVLSGCLNGEVNQHLLRGDEEAALQAAARMQDMVGFKHYFIEVHDHGLEEQHQVIPGLKRIASAINAPMAVSCDSHYTRREDWVPHDLMLCLSTGSKLDTEGRFQFEPEEFFLKSYDEMLERFPEEWLDNTNLISDQIDVKIEFGEHYFPEFPIPEDRQETVDEYFERKVWDGVRDRVGSDIPEAVYDRVNYEIRVIKDMGFPNYFLVVADLVNYAKSNGIRVGAGRGSAAGSYCSYALRITNLDPLRYGLLFERFLVPGRKALPDIDLDFDDRYRNDVIDYARRKYGEDRVAHIATFSTIHARSAIRDASRVMNYDYSTGDKIAKAAPEPIMGVSKSLSEALESGELRKVYESDADARKIIDHAKGLEGVIRQTGIHAAGVVIARSDITDYVPVMQRPERDGTNGPLVTQWDMHRVEEAGQLKVDFLGLRNLGVVDMCIDAVRERRGIDIDIDNIPLDDLQTYQTLCNGETSAVFQIESPGMTSMTMALRPDSIEDIMALISLYRPGPLGSGMDKMFIARKHGREDARPAHPLLEDHFAHTYGLMIYQEQILATVRILAGFDAGEADDLRKAVGKKYFDKLKQFRQKFVDGCAEHNGINSATANKIFSDIEHFGNYGFNAAHAASYALLSYQTAYLKTHYPPEYMAALLTSVKVKEKAARYLNECRRMGITVLPPSINKSESEFRVLSDEEILFGISSIDGVGPSVAAAILERGDAEYRSLYDFLRRCNPAVLNKTILDHLARSGAFDELMPQQQDRVLVRDDRTHLLNLEKEELGLYVSDHPLVGVWHLIESSLTGSIEDMSEVPDGASVTIGGVIVRAKKITTRRGDTMYRLILEDLTDNIEVLVFPNTYKSLDNPDFVEGDIVTISGHIMHEGDETVETKLVFNSMDYPEIPDHATGEPIIIRCPRPPSYGIVEKMDILITRHPGDSPVYLEFPVGAHNLRFGFANAANLSIKDDLILLGKTDSHDV